MPDADVSITAGVGTKIDSRTVGAGSDEHRQVMCVGDPSTAAAVAAVTAANGMAVDVTRLPSIPAGSAAIGSVIVTSAPTTAVTGAFFQATQPVSLAAGVDVTDRMARLLGIVEDIRDSSRNARIFMLDTYTAAPVAEALQTVVQWFGNAAVGGTTQPAVVTTGKTLRLTGWSLSTKSLATVGSVVLRIRARTGGLVLIGSPLVFSAEAGSSAAASAAASGTVAMTGGLGQVAGVFPEGFEFPAGTGLGFTLAGYGPTGTLTLQGVTRFVVHGYEY